MATIPSTLNTGLSAEQVMEAFDNALTHVPGTSTPAMDGTGAAGTAETFSRSDHVHPSDTSKQNSISSAAPIASECVSPMTGYSKSSSSTPGAISTSDTLNAAIGKLEKRTDLNETNISKDTAALVELVDGGAKNRLHPEQDVKATWIDFVVDKSESGDYRVYFGSLASTDTDATTCAVRLGLNGVGFVSESTQCSRGTAVSTPITATEQFDYVRVYYSDNNSHSSGDSATITNPMLCTKAAWDISQAYVPYAMSAAEVTAWINAHST